jgi:uncharacterized protein DUF4239
VNRWLLNNLTTWQLVLMLVGGSILLSTAAFALVRRFVSAEIRFENNEVGGVLLGLLGAFYGIVLGFAIVVLYEDMRAADASVAAETTALAQLYRSTDVFPPAARIRVGKTVAQYALAVRTDEWRLMRNGQESTRAHDLLGTLYGDVESLAPKGFRQQTSYSQAVNSLAALVAARRDRLTDAAQQLPQIFQILLLGGGVVIVVFLLFFGSHNFRAHLVMIGAVAGVLSFSLALTLMLAYPFSGQLSVSSDPFRLGIVGQLNPHTGLPTGRTCFNCNIGP